MSSLHYRDYCNEEVSNSKRPTISAPVPVEPIHIAGSYTTLPYADEGSPSPSPERENAAVPYPSDNNFNSQPTLERSAANMQMSPTDTVDTVIHNPVDGASNLTYDTPLRRSVGNFEPLIRPEEPINPPPQDLVDDEMVQSESEKLMNHNSIEKKNNSSIKKAKKPKRTINRAQSYSPGSCGYCLSNMSCVNIFLWISLVLVLIGWSVAIWRSIDSMQFMTHFNIRGDYTLNGFPFTDMTIIVIAGATLLFSIAFLVTSTYTSQSLSSYHLPSSQLNKCAYCFSVTMTVFSCIAVILWTMVIAVTMIPTTVISLIHLLFGTGSLKCVHLPSYGIANFDPPNRGKNLELQLHCDDDLQKWLEEAWSLMTPLLFSLGCAVFLQIILMGFIVVVSSNGRHLYERMGYLSNDKEPHDEDDNSQRQPFI